MYREYKEIARSFGLNFYVCCDGSITINEGKNRCGTMNPDLVSRYPYFKLCNSAAISTFLPLFKEKKQIYASIKLEREDCFIVYLMKTRLCNSVLSFY